jgi:lipoprotein-anchoring transpeptidase ErfK/SrfK
VDRRCRPRWYRVQLPVRPNGATGYVRAASVQLVPIATRIEIDLSERRVDLYVSGKRVVRARATVGAESTPTPTGSFYVNQRLLPGDPSGPFGPAALGISAFSPVLQHWTQGGPIAIHGTNRPELIGEAASHGCLRVENGVMATLFRLAPAGTPVRIAA